MFPITAAALPLLRTKQALLILDLQNDFTSPNGALAVSKPVGFVSRILEVAKAFRDSGAGDVIWIRSAFESHRSLSADGEQIITSDAPAGVRGRGRQRPSSQANATIMEADEEAFLSVRDGEQPTCVRPQTGGFEFAPEIQAAVDTNRDVILTKSHYSPFASGQQLLQLLRGRLVTEMYVCGALTNVSIYATALDAAKHGYAMTIVEDCCGYRKEARHTNAVRQLVQLTGSEVMNAANTIASLRPSQPPLLASPPTSGGGRVAGASRSKGRSQVQLGPSQAVATQRNEQIGLTAAISRLSLSGGGPTVHPSPDSAQPLPPTAAVSRSDSKAAPAAMPPTPDVAPQKLNRPIRVVPAPLPASRGDDSSEQSQNFQVGQEKVVPTATAEPLKEPAKLPPRASQLNIVPDIMLSPDRPSLERPEAITKVSGDTSSEPERRKDVVARGSANIAQIESEGAPTPIISESFCEGDTHVITNILPPSLAADAFERLMKEVSWAGMSHLGGEVPRRVAVQGFIDEEGNMPIYRHPSDESPQLLPFSPTVLAIMAEVQKHVGHPLNHVLIQHYRSGTDYISEHSDKTLDVVSGSFLANLSLGAERTMVYRTKRAENDRSKKAEKTADSGEEGTGPSLPPAPLSTGEPRGGESASASESVRQVQRAALPHNSLCRMGLATNMRWLHAIRQDKRLDRDKTAGQLAYRGERISLTFRHIGTFLDATQSHIWGQGATAKTRAEARSATVGQTPEAIRMLQAFGAENHHADFDWADYYGGGFDVLHMGVPKRFCSGSDPVLAKRVALALADLGISYAKGHVELPGGEVRFEDNDAARTVTAGQAATLLYLDAWYARPKTLPPQQDLAAKFTRFQAALDLLEKWRMLQADTKKEHKGEGNERQERGAVLLNATKRELAIWEDWAGEVTPGNDDGGIDGVVETEVSKQGKLMFIAGGDRPSIADYALWPVLHDMACKCGESVLGGGKAPLHRYYESFRERSSVMKVLRMEGGRKDQA